jgi:hypothetical protein
MTRFLASLRMASSRNWQLFNGLLEFFKDQRQ